MYHQDVVFEWISGKEILGLRFKDMSELKFQCHDDTWALIITLVSWLGYIGDYTTHLHRDANIWIAITVSSQYNGMAQGFWSLLTSILQSQPVHKRPLCWHQKLVFHQTCFSFFCEEFKWVSLCKNGTTAATTTTTLQNDYLSVLRNFLCNIHRKTSKTLPQMSLSSCTCFRYI